jgi:hypothetical protein
MYHGALLSVIDCAHLDNLASATAEMIVRYSTKDTTLSLTDIQHYCPRPSKSLPSYYDMNGYMLSLIKDTTDYTRWKHALDKAVPYAVATPWWYSTYSNGEESVDMKTYSGISCYIPQEGSLHSNLNAKFTSTSWYHAAGWEQIGW